MHDADRPYYNGVRPLCRVGCRVALLALSLASTTLPLMAQTRVVTAAARAAPLAPVLAKLSGLDPRWSATFDSVPAAPPAFDERAAFLPLKGGPFVAIDLERGRLQWRLDLSADFTPAVGGGRVFVAVDGAIVAIDAVTGKVLWRTPLPDTLAAPLYWDTGWLIASTAGGDLAAFRAEDGELVWRKVVGASLIVSPIPALDRLYVPLSDSRVLCLDLATGDLRWEYKVDGRITGVVAIDAELLVGATSNQVIGIGLSDGRYRRRWRVGADPVGAAVADARHIYFAALDNVLRAVDRRNGNLRWMQTLPSRPSGGPLLADNVVLIPFVSTALAAFGTADGKADFAISSTGELAGPPHLRLTGPLTGARLITVSREGRLQGFGEAIEAAPAVLAELPGTKVGG